MTLNEILLTGLISNPSIYLTQSHKDSIKSQNADFSLKEINFDSLAKMELSIWLELELKIIVTDHDMSKISTFNELSSLVEEKLKNKISS